MEAKGISNGDSVVGKWNDVSCKDKKNYICKKYAAPLNKPQPKVLCDGDFSDFLKFQGDCYMYVDVPKLYDDAEEFCIDKGAHLVSILNEVEQAFVQVNIPSGSAWIGLSNTKNQDEFVWSDGWAVKITNWGNEVVLNSSSLYCATMNYENGLWFPQDCSGSFPFICKHSESMSQILLLRKDPLLEF